jgi:hypothetical protein
MKVASLDQELKALKTILHALEPLDETQRRFVLKTVADRMGISDALPATTESNQQRQVGSPSASVGAAGAAGGSRSSLDRQTAKQFLKAKLPKTDVLKIACLAYYLTHAKSQPRFKTNDITKLNIEAGGMPLSNPSMAVSNATKQNKFLGAVGHGSKQITALGEDVVDALPNEEAVKTALANQRKPRKKRAKKGASKAK